MVTTGKVLAGFGWVALARYFNRLLGFLTTLVLAKLLVPEDFGVVAVALIAIEVLQIFKDMGVSHALIYQKERLKEASDAAFVLIVGLNLVLFGVAVALAPLAASFFDNDAIVSILIVMSSNLVWNAVRSVPDALIRKEVEFRKLLIPETVPVVIASIASVWMAYEGFGAWSLVCRSLIVNVLAMLLIWRFTTYRPSLKIDLSMARELIGYGKFILGASIITVCMYNLDKLYISKFGSLELLGVYTLAYTIANIPVTELGHIICRVMFPVFSKLNDQVDLLRESLVRTIKFTTMLTIPAAFGIATYGPLLVRSVYDSKWWGMIVPLQILAFAALARSVSAIIFEFFKATGVPKLMQQFLFFRLVSIGFLGIPVFLYSGLNGLSLLIAATYTVALFWETLMVSKRIELPVRQVVRVFMLPLVYSAVFIPGLYWLVVLGIDVYAIVEIAIGVVLTMVSYAGCVYLFDRTTMTEIARQLAPRKGAR